jgi:hypothetical protein
MFRIQLIWESMVFIIIIRSRRKKANTYQGTGSGLTRTPCSGFASASSSSHDFLSIYSQVVYNLILVATIILSAFLIFRCL